MFLELADELRGYPENIMKFIMQHIKDGCKITIDSLENFGGDFDA